MRIKNRTAALAAITWCVISQGEASAQCGTHQDILIGRTAAGQLKIQSAEFTLGNAVLLCPVDGLLHGFANGNPGFDAAEVVDDPGNDFFQLAAGSQIRLEAVAIAAPFKVWGPSLSSLIDAPGERILLGNSELHEHVTWLADSEDAAFHPQDVFWLATFRLIDTGSTGYAASAPFTIQFRREVPVPAVSAWGACVLALLMANAASITAARRCGRLRHMHG